MPDENHGEYAAEETNDNPLLQRTKNFCGISAAMSLGRERGYSAEKTHQKEIDRKKEAGTYGNGCQIHRADPAGHHCIDKAHTGIG